MKRKTKIVCTMGPAVKDLEMVKSLLLAGMNAARFNFSHGDHQYHKEMVDIVIEASRVTSIPVALILDTKGPEIRTGLTKDNALINLVTGSTVMITAESVDCTDKILSVSYKDIAKEVRAGTHILIADGLIDLEVLSTDGSIVNCIVRNGGSIGSRKNVNVVGVKIGLPAVTEKDIADIMFAVENNFDYIAASFIRKPSDVMEIKAILDAADSKIGIIAKIEDQEGFDNINEIIRVSDGIMVARGDLGVQVKAEEIPLIQKRIIKSCNDSNKFVITATQMLESMINNPIPTRAEVTDVANAIFDGTDAIMLSGETANGKYPIKAVEYMNRISLETESSSEYKEKYAVGIRRSASINMAESVARAAASMAKEITADAILTPSLHGNTPKFISKYRPDQIIIAATPYEEIRRKLLLYWGVYPVITNFTDNSDYMINSAIDVSKSMGLVKPFDRIVIVAGIPVNSPIMLNTIKIELLAKVICKGLRGYGERASGKVVKVNSIDEAKQKIKGNGKEILVAKYIDESYMPVLKKVVGYILEEFSSMSWADIEKENNKLVAIAGANNALKMLDDNMNITIDGKEKMVFEGVDS